MIYRLYDNEGSLVDTEDNCDDALQIFGEDYDKMVDDFGKGLADGMTVKVFVDKGKGLKSKFAEYSIREFLNKNIKFQPMTTELYNKLSDPKNLEEDLPDFRSEDSREFEERAKAFDDDEYRTVLKYVPTGFILGELMRRFDEYNKATDGIASLLDNMKIYNKE